MGEQVFKGVSFPFRIGSRGRVVSNKLDDFDESLIEDSLKQIILTRRGERPMEPEFGSDVMDLVFQSSLPSLDSVVEQLLTEAIERWEPRVELNQVTVERDYVTIYVRVSYTILDTQNIPRELVVPVGGEE